MWQGTAGGLYGLRACILQPQETELFQQSVSLQRDPELQTKPASPANSLDCSFVRP